MRLLSLLLVLANAKSKIQLSSIRITLDGQEYGIDEELRVTLPEVNYKLSDKFSIMEKSGSLDLIFIDKATAKIRSRPAVF